TEYDTLTSAVTKKIRDVNTTTATNEPAGWVTPPGGGLHLTRTYEVDSLGRVTKETDPLGQITYTVYRDALDEVRIYRGWNASTNTPTGPTVVERHDEASSYKEMLTMSVAPTVSGGRPTGTEAISALQSLSRNYLDTGDRVTHTDAYFSFAGLTYSTAANIGTRATGPGLDRSGAHYYRSFVNYDVRGRQDRVEDWTGTIQRRVYDARGRIASIWRGTDDTPTIGEWSPTNTAGTNLVKAAEFTYDGGAVGDGNLTKSRVYTDLSSFLDMDVKYDFRNREIGR